MRFSFAKLLVVVSGIAAVQAQVSVPSWTTGLPPCALGCVQAAALIAGCKIDDIACLCRSPTFISNVRLCIRNNCPSVSDVNTTENILLKLCGGIIITDPVPTLTAVAV